MKLTIIQRKSQNIIDIYILPNAKKALPATRRTMPLHFKFYPISILNPINPESRGHISREYGIYNY